MKLRAYFVIVSFLSMAAVLTLAQTPTQTTSLSSTQVPRLIKFSGVAKDEAGKPKTGLVGVTFSLYKDQEGGSPLWVETENVQADASGHYTALLGSATADGVPLSLFSSAEVHWVSTQISGQPEQPRVLLLSVPYALKAADAETLGGMPASAFLHASAGATPGQSGSPGAPRTAPNLPPAGVTGKGTKNFVPVWTGATTLGNSVIYETGGNVGIGTKTPQAALDVASTGTLGIQAAVPGTQAAISGIATANSGGTTGTYGQSSDPSGNGVLGVNKATTGGFGVIGQSNATSGTAYGMYGQSASTAGSGVVGSVTATTGQVKGVGGFASSTSAGAVGVAGFELAKTGQVYGVSGGTNSTTTGAAGVIGFEGATTGPVYGVNGSTNSGTSGAAGVFGHEGATAGGPLYGVWGLANSTNGIGVFGSAQATSGFAVGVEGSTSSSGGTAGQFVNLSGSGLVLLGQSGSGFTNVFTVDASGNGFYAGNLNVTGKLTKGSGSFKIDHPLDPANKYLSHSFVESPDMMNVYNGNITTDRHGLATVNLPDYFESLNGDFRYQLTVIGQFAQAIVKREIANNRFTIKTNKPLVKVSWQVTGIRHDAYANQYRIPVEEQKTSGEQGYYLHPEVFGQPESKSISAAQKSAPSSPAVVADASHQ